MEALQSTILYANHICCGPTVGCIANVWNTEFFLAEFLVILLEANVASPVVIFLGGACSD